MRGDCSEFCFFVFYSADSQLINLVFFLLESIGFLSELQNSP